MYRNLRSKAPPAGTDYQRHLRGRINEVMALKRALRVLLASHTAAVQEKEDTAADNVKLRSDVRVLGKENLELKADVVELDSENMGLILRAEVHHQQMMALAARYPAAFDEITTNPAFGPFESDL